jgi:hypothetical protein
MKEIKFSYIAQHEDTGVWMEQIFDAIPNIVYKWRANK